MAEEQVLTTVVEARAAAAARPLRMAWLPQRWYAHVILWIACIIIGFPLFYALIIATQSNAQFFAKSFIPGSSLLDNFNVVWNARGLGGYMFASTLVAVLVAGGKTVLSLLAGLAFVYFRFPGKWLVFGFVLVTLMMPIETMAVALFRIVSGFGWGSSYAGLVLPLLASATGTFLFRQHFASIPPELSEAAQLDGATPLQFLFRVLIPISWNTIGALVVIQFLYAWNLYLWPRMLDTPVVQIGLRSLVAGAESGDTYGPIMLGAVIASLPPLVVFLALQKQFMSGFALTRDK